MSYLDAFSDEMNRTFSIYPKGGLDSDGEVTQGFSSTASVSNKRCMYWTGSAAENLVADRFKTQISGVIVCDVVEVPNGSKIVLDSGQEFGLVNADDVGFQGEALVIAVKAVNDGTDY